MTIFERLESEKLRMLAGMCGGFALLLFIALVLQNGGVGNFLQKIKLTASVPYWNTQSYYGSGSMPSFTPTPNLNYYPFPDPIACQINHQSGSHDPNCTNGWGGILSGQVIGTNIGQWVGSTVSATGGGCYAYGFGTPVTATSSSLIVQPGSQVELDWSCQPKQYTTQFLACGNGWAYPDYDPIFTAATVQDSSGTTYPSAAWNVSVYQSTLYQSATANTQGLIGSTTINANWTPGVTKYYRLYCTNGSGVSQLQATLPVIVTSASIALSANPTSIPSGSTSALNWNTTNASQCTITTPEGGAVGSQGLGTDESANAVAWTPTNITYADQLVDTPTDDFPILNQIYYYSPNEPKGTVQAGGLAANGGYGAVAGWQLTSGQWYWEYTVAGASGGHPIVGIWEDPTSGYGNRAYPGHNNDTGIGYGSNGVTYYDSYISSSPPVGITLPTLSTFTNGDVIGVAYDAATGKVYFSKNGVWQNGANPSAGTGYVGIVKNGWPGLTSYYGKTYINFGQGGTTGLSSQFAGGYFAYPPPSGYVALSTNNLPAPAVSQPSQYFSATTYTGNGASQTVTTGFQPDLVWIKNRVTTYFNTLTDSTRGTNSDLFSNSTSVPSANDPNGWVSALTSLGFTAGGQCTATPNDTNLAGDSYVAWAWKKSPADGVDVVSYTGNGVASRQIAHALGTAPNMIVVKRADGTGDWYVWSSALTDQSYFVKLDTTDAPTNSNSPWGAATSGNFTSSYFTVGSNATNNLNASGAQYVAYTFSNRAGFSQMGTYVGNGSTDGPFINTGFDPEFVLVKRIDTTGGWNIWDLARGSSNPINATLYPNLSSVESGSGGIIDFLSNGFKLRYPGTDYDASGGTYMYMAFASQPFSVANAPAATTIADSMRFDQNNNNESLIRTPATTGSQQKGTLSLWVKRGQLSSQNGSQIIATTQSRDELVAFAWNCSADELDVRIIDGTGNNGDLCTSSSALLRDPSHWYHIVVAYDTTQATASNRVKVYVDGVQQTLTGTQPNQNATTAQWNVAAQPMSLFHDIYSNGYNLDGEVADVYYIDGTQLTPSSFGSYDSNGNWRPAAYSGSYGTNGFHLTFTNGLSLGADSSGLGNNLFANSLSTLDQVIDTPTNNFATLDEIYYYTTTYTKGIVQAGGLAANGYYGAVTGWQLNSGLWYWENTVGGASSAYPIVGVWKTPVNPNGSQSAYPGHTGDMGFGYEQNGEVTQNGTYLPQVVSGFQNGDVVGVAYNANTGAVYVSKNGQWQNGTNLIPQMTAATTNGVTMSASTYYTTGYEAWRAADRNSNGSYWYTYGHVPSALSPDWLMVNFGSNNAKTVASYSIQNYNGGANSYDPINFQLQGSNDGLTWATLDTETNVGWSTGNQVQYFTVPSANRGSNQYYRLYVTGAGAVNVATGYLIINEFGLYSSATQSPLDGSVQPIGYVTNGWPGLGSYYGKTYVNFGQGGGQSTSFADSSSYNRAISAYGEVVATTTTAKFTASAYFSGSSALTTPQTPALMPSGNYTIDMWVDPSYASNGGEIFVQDLGSGYSPYLVEQSGNSFLFYASSQGGNSGWDIAQGKTICSSLTANTWYHIAVVRSGSTYDTFCNGVLNSTWTSSATPWQNGADISIGKYNTGGTYFQGYIDEVRFSNTARWTSNFTPSSSPYTSDSNTLLLLHMGNGASNFYNSSAGGYFAYTPPTGYMALSTNNLAVAVPPAVTQPSNYFNAVAYSGNAGVPSYDTANKGQYITLSNGNYDATSGNNGWTGVVAYSTNTFSSGKWYAEFKMTSSYPVSVGIGDSSKPINTGNLLGYLPTEYGYYPWNACFYNNNVCTAAPNDYAVGTVYMVSVDMNAGKIWFGVNGAWLNGGNPATGANPTYTGITGTKAFAVSAWAGAGAIHAAFGEAGTAGTTYYSSAGGYFFYQPPSGFLALPTGSSQNISLNFEPDLVWIKNRLVNYSNTLVDSARGAGINLYSNTSGAQVTGDINGSVMSFNTNGFTAGGACAAPTGNVNATNTNYISWSWKKSPAAGIDIETYTGNGSTQSITDTLGTAPNLIITKNVSAPSDWYVGGSALGGGNYLTLDTTNAVSISSSPYGADLIPTMTAATTNGVTMSATSYVNGNWLPYQAGDKNINSGWESAAFSTLSAAAPQWLQVDFGSGNPQTVGAYTLTPYTSGIIYSPTSFTLQGSNDGVNFTVLDTENVSWVYAQPQTFYIPAANQGSYRYYRLNVTADAGSNYLVVDELNLWQAPVNSASSFGVYNSANTAANQYISYLFSNRSGFSQFGTYMGDGAPDGPFIYTGFKPAFVMVKDAVRNNSYTNWTIFDNVENITNPASTTLFANLSVGNIGGSGDSNCTPTNNNCLIDFLSNGFKIRNGPWEINGATEPYLYAAFASVPLKSAYTQNGYTIPYSLRFDASNNAYLSRTPTLAATSNQKQTFSAWVKRGVLGVSQYIVNYYSGPDNDGIRFESNDTLSVIVNGTIFNTAPAVFRDPEWVHIVADIDLTQAAHNDVKLYVNGVPVALTITSGSDPSGTTLASWSAAGVPEYIGRYGSGPGNYQFDGEMADVYSVDGQALPPTSFGSYDTNGFWKPQLYSSVFGNNGFHLDFEHTNYTNFSSGTGAVTVGPLTQSTTYTLQCTPIEGGLISTTATVNVYNSTAQANLTICDQTGLFCSDSGADPAPVASNSTANISWTSSGVRANSCTVSDSETPPVVIGNVNSQATTTTPTITQNTTYTLQCQALDPTTLMLLHMDGTNGSGLFTDSSDYARSFTAVAAAVSTAASEFGGASGSFDGSSAYVSTPSTPELIPASDYTIDLWVDPTTVSGTRGILSKPNAAGFSPYYIFQSGSGYYFYASSNGTSWDIANGVSLGSATSNIWTHLAVVRSGNTYYLFNNGLQTASFTSSATPYSSTDPLIVGEGSAGTYFAGYIDEVRFSNVARWTGGSNGVQYFTPSSSAYAPSTVTSSAAVAVNNTCATGTGSAPNSCSAQCVLDTSTNAPTTSGGATISWCCPGTPTSGANFSTGGAQSGSVTVTPQTTTAYTLSCPTGQGTITLTPANLPSPPSASNISLYASRVRIGNPSTLSWTVNGMATGISCTMSPALPGGMPGWDNSNPWSSQGQTGSIFIPTHYTLTCGNGVASSSASATVPLVPLFKEI